MSEPPSSTEEAIELYLVRRRSGDAEDPAAFAARYPALQPELARALEALLAVEHVAQIESDHETSIPERVGAFRVVREIGRGGMGVVLEAVEEPLGRRVALKVLPPELLSSPSARARFRREAELVARIDHSGIATVYGAGVQDEHPWIAMRFVDGETLADAIARSRADGASCVRSTRSSASGREAALAVAACLAKVARTLQFAHERGVVHRDVKPSNIIVAPDGTPVLLDFGLAIAAESSTHTLTRTGETAGTPAYLAPENISGELAHPDTQCDVYALGVTLYECLALRKPFDAPTRVALYRAICTGTPADLRAHNRAVPRDLAVVVATAMERDRGHRYRSAAALADDLEACVAGRPIAARPVPLYGRVLRWARREPRQALLASLLTVAALVSTISTTTWWASRGEVHAAALAAHERERDEALAEGYFELQDLNRADLAFQHALALDPTNLEALAGRVLVPLGTRNLGAASVLLRDAPATPGFDALRDFCRGMPIAQDKELLATPRASSLDFFLTGSALQLETHGRGIAESVGIEKRALAMFDEAVVRAPGPREFMHIRRALAAKAAHDERRARSATGALLTLWPDSSQALLAAGSVLSELDPQAARPLLERAALLRDSDAAPYQTLANVCMNLAEPEEAEHYLWLALARGWNAPTYNSLGNSFAMRGCIDDAASAYERALAVDSRYENAWLNYALIAMQKDELPAAVFRLERALDLDPWNAGAHGYLGITERMLGDMRSAQAHLACSLALDARRPDFWEELARAQEALGEQDAARESVQAGLRQAKNYPPLLELRAQLESTK
jgi:serine/threonine protein kinase/Tfp pilus assembly protein PilF